MNFDLGNNITQMIILFIIAVALLFTVNVFQKKIGKFSAPLAVIIIVVSCVIAYLIMTNNLNMENDTSESFLVNPEESESPIYEHFQEEQKQEPQEVVNNQTEPIGSNETNVNERQVNNNLEPSVEVQPSTNSNNSSTFNVEDMLPVDSNSLHNQVNPNGQGALENKNLLNATHHIGVDTQGCSLRNANRGLRSEPPNPQVQVSPWLQTTICPDLLRKPLDDL
jgi:hypothetical protein